MIGLPDRTIGPAGQYFRKAVWERQATDRGGKGCLRADPQEISPACGCQGIHKPHSTKKAVLVLQHAFEEFDILAQTVIGTDSRLDFAHRMQYGCMVTAPETASDLRQRAQSQDF